MHIQEIIVDGFKSYAHRTVIAGFDTHFNAITGLNGSGKSNILDSICFVLGITNLSHVRAGNLTELVYKQGQAGVTKATVTIVFNNEDESGSPVGYEECPEVTVTRQVLIGGKSKYLINGRVSPAGQVQNLFHSVQLNVNNPHFLIMQGRITKVLNMKPHEILGMVEEAAGTRMYETKKVAALKTIEKKQKKLDELNNVLSEEINPTLERLRGEKQHYLKWSKNNADIERIERFVVASDFMRASDAVAATNDETASMQKQIDLMEEDVNKCKEELEQKEQEISQLSDKIAGDFENELKEIKKVEDQRSKQLVKVTTSWNNKKKAVQSAQGDLNAARELVTETRTAVQEKENNIGKDREIISKIQQDSKDADENLKNMTTDYQNMCAGISSSQGDEGISLPQQISKAHVDANNAEAKAKQARMKHSHLNKSIKDIEKQMKKEEKSAETLGVKKDKSEEKIQSIKEKLSHINFSESEFESHENEKVDLENSIGQLQEVVDTLSAQLQGRLAFNYSDPVKGFDRSKVKGMVASLVKVKNSVHSTALEVVAGGKLYQVVVDEAITGKALLNKGKLQRRVTIIPLDKITPRTIPNAVSTSAKSMAKSLGADASPAIELVGFDEEIRNAVEYVFGSSLVVDTVEAANRICDSTRTRTVTLEGDVYDPSGTISGGSKNNLGTTLAKLSELSNATAELHLKQSQMMKLSSKLDGMKSQSKQYSKLKAQLEIAEAELSAVKKHISQTSYGMIEEKFQTMMKEIEEAETEAEAMDKEKERKWALYNKLKAKEKELTMDREAKLKEIEAALKKAKKAAAETALKAREAETQSQTFTLELDSLRDEVLASEEAVKVAEKALKEAKDAENEIQIEAGEMKSLYEEVKRNLDDITQKISTCSVELKKLNKEKGKVLKAMETAGLESKKLTFKLSKYQKERANSQKVVEVMLKKYSWIEAEKSAFGIPGGDYDFNAVNPDTMSNQLNNLKNEQNNLAKKINKKVMGMIEKAEGEYTELLRKRKVVENDKKKIHAVIEELDIKKKAELERTWVKVNRDFGSIFSTLLPGASSKLEPPEGMQAWEGLEVKVAFGGVWKESLSELSGGQRSLLALSLILSLLLFKPAPMYILDEVDAALDLSHTQNIGNMLKTHFSQSQFIVVSLKEGMFNNANVIFRTKFVDGVSTVTRTLGVGVSTKSRALANSSNNNNNFLAETPATKRTALSQSSRKTAQGKEN